MGQEISYTIMNMAWMSDGISPISVYGIKLLNNSNEKMLQTEYHTSTLYKYMKYLYGNDCIMGES